jgi:hypothetical protein
MLQKEQKGKYILKTAKLLLNMINYRNLVKTSLDDFKRNKVRTFLTSLGIMVGVFSVVILIALGLGLKNYIQGQFQSMGANLIMILPGVVVLEQVGVDLGDKELWEALVLMKRM